MLKHVLGNTWCAEISPTIPVYKINPHEVILSGYADRDRAALVKLLDGENLRVRAIIGSHSHNDHNGNHAYFQKEQGAEIILRDVEAAVVSSPSLLQAAYFPATTEQLRQELPHLILQADRTFSAEDRESKRNRF